ncbi:MAG: TonB-dependent receptor plug domain-containing protein [Bacteroidia bacterium]
MFSALLLWGFAAQAQCTMRGRVTSGTDGEMLVGAVVRIMNGEQLAGGAYSDLEGAYTIKGGAGTYTMIVSYLGYISDSTSVTLTEGSVAVRDVILYEDAPAEGDVVEIIAKANKASSATFMKKKMNSLSSIDGITNDVLQRTGDNNVAAALQRVSGVTVEGGKYVYVRGLGDRYSKTLLNGATIPSLDPDRNAVQLDLFPSNLIDNIVIHKTFTPDLPGDFTGGLVDVITRDFPDKFKMNVGYTVGYNDQASLIDDFLSYNTGKTDWLGYDDGTRGVPAEITVLDNLGWPDLGQYANVEGKEKWQEVAQQYTDATVAFATRDSIVPAAVNAGLNQAFQFSIGNQYELFGKPFGFIAGVTYNNSYQHAPNSLYGRYKNTSDATSGNIATGLNTLRELNYTESQQKVVWGALAKLSYKITDKNSISVNIMRNQGGTSNSQDYAGTFPEDNTDDILQSSTLAYTERYMNTLQVEGDHLLGVNKDKGVSIDWIASFTDSRQKDPNLRFFHLTVHSGSKPGR